MRWKNEGIIIGLKNYSEGGKIISIFAKEHGVYSGFYSQSKVMLRIGDLVCAEWYARSEDNLGSFRCEVLSSAATSVFLEPKMLMILSSGMRILSIGLSQRQFDCECYDASSNFINSLSAKKDWRMVYLKLEIALLKYIGFGMDLSKCAVSGVRENIKYISPKTGKAVSESVAEPYKDRLLSFPLAFRYLDSDLHNDLSDLNFIDALDVTGYFLLKHLFKKPILARIEVLKSLSRNN